MCVHHFKDYFQNVIFFSITAILHREPRIVVSVESAACLSWVSRERCLYERARLTFRETAAAGWRARTQHRVPHIQHEQNHHVLDFCAFYLLHLFTWHRRTNKVTSWSVLCVVAGFRESVWLYNLHTAASLQANDG